LLPRKLATNIVGGLLGLAFVAFSLLFFFGPTPPPPPDSLPGKYMAAFGPTGYLAFVRILELLGGALVAVPITRPASSRPHHHQYPVLPRLRDEG
jgi:drug/metabolite transporter (DMT)-like permease